MTQSPTSQPSRIVIIGAALAGASAAIALRDQGYQGELTVIGEEGELPYERPPLSKAVLIGERDEPDWVAEEPRLPGSIGVARSSSLAVLSIHTTSC
jgi:NADPH-dependent 2,4-dienoyl-CoA reductase/sulfur reductase-like enzyme